MFIQNYTEENPSLVPFRYPWCIGGMIWTGIDYLGESMGYPSKGWSGSMIRTNGERGNHSPLKPGDIPMLHIHRRVPVFLDHFIPEGSIQHRKVYHGFFSPIALQGIVIGPPLTAGGYHFL